MKFKEIELNNSIIEAITKMGYEEMTPIQEKAIPAVLEGKDIIGLAATGTGKTAAFSLPIIDKLINNYNVDNRIKALILCPTRELAIQTRDNIVKYSEGTGFRCGVILGGVNQESQKKVLKRGIDILVATPGRLVDFINQRKVNLSNVSMLVLDEADTMLDMGFIHDIRTIVAETNKSRQTLLFSATMSKDILNLTKDFMNNPITINIESKNITVDKVKQEVYFVDSNNKTNLLLDLISTQDKPSTLIFTRTKHGANKLEDELNEYQIRTSVIHGNKTQSNRVRALQDFKNGNTRIMIATDIAARGIDINDLGLVVNYDMPEQPEVYVHRIGRTARAGKEGRAVSLCSSAEVYVLRNIEHLISQSIEQIEHKYPMVLKEERPVRGGRSRNNSNRSTDRRGPKDDSSRNEQANRSRSDRSISDKPREGRNTNRRSESSRSYRGNGAGSESPRNYRTDRTNNRSESPRNYKNNGEFSKNEGSRSYRSNGTSNRNQNSRNERKDSYNGFGPKPKKLDSKGRPYVKREHNNFRPSNNRRSYGK